MKKILFLLLASAPAAMWAQCNVTNATDCHCLDGGTECDLLPDITASYDLLIEPDETVENPGQILLSVGTPNIGHGPLRVLPTDSYVCGLDTIYSPGGLDECPDGSAPHQIIDQRIYHKSGSDMTFTDKNAGTMTYHPTHGHFHTDNWGTYTLRIPIDGEDDPTAWPIVGAGTKMGFCLMDLADCASPGNYGYCREDDGTVITNDIENYGLGGGNYNCGVNNQGITVGNLDIYDYYLDGMEIIVPAGVCNGDYYIVVEIDPNNNYSEESDDNNVISMPFTLTEQPEDIDFIPLTVVGGIAAEEDHYTVCATDGITLEAPLVGTSYLWSTGATTSSITVTEAGDYFCLVDRTCGELYTDTIHVEMIESLSPIVEAVDEVCAGSPATLNATADGLINWYDAVAGGTLLGSGSPFTTTDIFETTTFYAESENIITITLTDRAVGEIDHMGSNYSTGSPYNGWEEFDALEEFTLNSVKVFTDYPGVREIELRDADDNVLQSTVVDIPSGTTVIDLNYNVPIGTNYHLGTNDAANEDLFGEISPKLKRSDESTNYPYTIDGVVSITGSSFDMTRWYYFYDWRISGTTTFTCPSVRVPVTVEAKICDAIGDLSNLNSFNVFPNPTDGNFTIELNTNPVNEINVSVTNITGQELFHSVISNATGGLNIPVNIADHAAGVYMVKITTDGNSISKNIVIE
jgi:hypothetical protein